LRGSGDRQGSALDDLNPDEIESIEIIKGPAAATLYGTEASAGVIQIITKRGAGGDAQFSLSVTQGTNFMLDPSGKLGTQYGTDPATGELLVGFGDYPNVYEYEKAVNGNDPIGYGHSQGYTLSARGGTDAVRYFVSGSWNEDTGIVSYNWDKRTALRANLTALLTDNLTLDVAAGYTTGLTSYAQQLSEPGGIWEIMLWGQPALKDTGRRGFLRYLPEEIATVEATRTTVGSPRAPRFRTSTTAG
jgi:TonB-dependent SusC/RagA subfamily outer membrane receptor